MSNKQRNRRKSTYNGNRIVRNIIKLSHWNAGNAKWENKQTEIEALLMDKSPDLLFVTETNLWDSVPDYQRNINGYNLH